MKTLQEINEALNETLNESRPFLADQKKARGKITFIGLLTRYRHSPISGIRVKGIEIEGYRGGLQILKSAGSNYSVGDEVEVTIKSRTDFTWIETLKVIE